MQNLIRHNVDIYRGKWMVSWEYLRRVVAFPVGSQAELELFGLEPKSNIQYNVDMMKKRDLDDLQPQWRGGGGGV